MGVGYCPCTDWHWQIRRRLGDYDIPNSYIKFVLDKITGLEFDALIVDRVVIVSYFIALAISIFLNRKLIKRLSH